MIEHYFTTSPWWFIYAATVLYFLFLYFGFAALGEWVSRILQKKTDLTIKSERHQVAKTQVSQEISRSLISIAVFGFSGVLTQWAYLQQYVSIEWNITPGILLLEVLAIFVWNETHFYICHWLLHRKFFFRHVHYQHHQSHSPTPHSTYSFHWFEAVLLGSVMITIMPFYTFSYITLMILPVMSITLNVLGHWNIDPWPGKKPGHLLKFSYRHSLHHSKVNGNFGFFLPVFDRVFKTFL
jgi:Delta7-sterol 5-desaturase